MFHNFWYINVYYTRLRNLSHKLIKREISMVDTFACFNFWTLDGSLNCIVLLFTVIVVSWLVPCVFFLPLLEVRSSGRLVSSNREPEITWKERNLTLAAKFFCASFAKFVNRSTLTQNFSIRCYSVELNSSVLCNTRLSIEFNSFG